LEPNIVGNFCVKAIVNSPLHPLLGKNFAVITIEGRKTGRRYSLPIGVAREDDGIIAVSQIKGRTWWRNLRGDRIANLRVSGKQYTFRGEIVEGHEDVVAGLTSYITSFPRSAKSFGVRLDVPGQPNKEILNASRTGDHSTSPSLVSNVTRLLAGI